MAEATLGDQWYIYRRIVGGRIRSQWQYRVSFFADLITNLLFTVIDFVAIVVLFGNVDLLGEWALEDTALLYGLTATGFGLADLMVGSVDRVSDRIRTGRLDLLLVRPLGALTQIVAEDFKLRRVGRVLQGGTILAIALIRADIGWTIDRVVLVPLAVVGSAVLFGSLIVATSCVAFWVINAREAASAFTYGGAYLASYPIHIFAEWVQRAVFTVVPLAFVAYAPALRILDAPNPAGIPVIVQFLSPLVSLVALLATRRLWAIAIGNYRSTGS